MPATTVPKRQLNLQAGELSGITAGYATYEKAIAPNLNLANLYLSPAVGSNVASVFNANIRIFVPLHVAIARNLTTMIAAVTVAATVGTKCNVRLYQRLDAFTLGTELVNFGEFLIDSVARYVTTISYTLNVGDYFVSFHPEASVTMLSGAVPNFQQGRFETSSTSHNSMYGYYESRTYGSTSAIGLLVKNTSAVSPSILLK